MDKLALDDEGAGADDCAGRVGYADEVVCVVVIGEVGVALVPFLRGV